MTRLTRNGRLILDRLVEYLGAEVERQGRSVYIHCYGDGMPQLVDPPPVALDTWAAVGRLVFVATTLEEAGGMGCTWEGVHEAAGYEFGRDRDGQLILPSGIDATTDAMLSRLSEPEFYDYQADMMLEQRQEVQDAT